MQTLNLAEVTEIWLDSPVLRLPRKLKTRDDWGDQETVGVHLKIIGINVVNSKESDFGRFLGKHPNGFVVGIKNWEGRIVSGELFETLEELKQRWEID